MHSEGPSTRVGSKRRYVHPLQSVRVYESTAGQRQNQQFTAKGSADDEV